MRQLDGFEMIFEIGLLSAFALRLRERLRKQALLLHNYTAGLSALVLFAPLYFVRVPREEQMMLQHFGESYAGYMARTRRLLSVAPNH